MKSAVCGMFALSLMVFPAFAADIQLPAPQKTGGRPLMETLNARQTQRTFSSKPLSEQQLADLLWAAFGVNRADGRRTAPSARNMQEMDLYVALSSGLYLYDAKANVLRQVLSQDIRGQVGKQPFTKEAPVGLIYVAEYDRMKEPSEFYAAVDTGFISQNVYLFCASAGLHTVVLGMVDKEALHAAMKLKPSQHIMLTQPVGLPPEAAAEPAAPSAAAGALRDGTYTGSARGYDGSVQVAVTVAKSRISRVEVTRQEESRPKSALKEIPARIISRQKADVDGVSGATYTSRAVIAATEEALKQAR